MMLVARRQSATAVYGKAALARPPLPTNRRASDASQRRSRQNSGASSLASPPSNAARRPSVSLEIPGLPMRRMSASSVRHNPDSRYILADMVRQQLRCSTPSPTGSEGSYSIGDDVYFSTSRSVIRPRSTSCETMQSAISKGPYISKVSSAKDKTGMSETGVSKFPDLPVVEVKPPSVKSKDSSSTTSSERRQRTRGISDLSATSNYSCASQASALSSTLGPAFNACDPQEYLDLFLNGPYTPPARSRSNTMPSIRSRSSTLSTAAKMEAAYGNAYAFAAGTDPTASSSGDSLCKAPKKGKGKVRKGFSRAVKALGMSGRR